MQATQPRVTAIEKPEQELHPQDCLACRVIGTGALGATGVYALHSARPRAPGSRFGKGVIGLVGLGMLGASYVRWTQR